MEENELIGLKLMMFPKWNERIIWIPTFVMKNAITCIDFLLAWQELSNIINKLEHFVSFSLVLA